MKEIKGHHAYKIFLAIIALKLGITGVSNCSMSNFMTPIIQELGCSVSQFTMYTSINACTMALSYIPAGKLISKVKHLGVLLGIATLAEAIGLALMGTYTSVYQFYFSGFLIGASNAITGFVAIPIIFNMWFRKSLGTVMGITSAVASGVGIVYNYLSAFLISSVGWRTSYFILAAIGLIVSLPFVLMWIKSPTEANSLPYGADDVDNDKQEDTTSDWGLTKKQAFSMPPLYIAWLACIVFSYASGVQGYIVSYSRMELGQSLTFGANIALVGSLVGIVGNMVLGKINDKYGVKLGLVWGMVTTALGYCVIFLSHQSPIFVFFAYALITLGSGMYQVQCPLMGRNIFGNKNFSEIWSIMMVLNSLIGGGLYSSIGKFYDNYGTYNGAFIMGAICFIIAGVLGIVAVNIAEKQRKQL